MAKLFGRSRDDVADETAEPVAFPESDEVAVADRHPEDVDPATAEADSDWLVPGDGPALGDDVVADQDAVWEDADGAITDETLAAMEDDAPDADREADEVKPEPEPTVPVDEAAPLTDVGELHGWEFDWATGRYDPEIAKARKLKTNAVRPCLCNRLAGHECDLTTKTRFAIGHDARFKSVLQKAWREGNELEVELRPEDGVLVDAGDGSNVVTWSVTGSIKLPADEIARLLAPKLLPHVTHVTRTQRQAVADESAGTALPRTAVEASAE